MRTTPGSDRTVRCSTSPSARASRPAADDGKAADQAALWRLPAGGGEAVRVAALPGGVSAAETAAASDQVVLAAPVLPGPAAGAGSEGDAERRQAREDAGVTAILHESVPVRYWDHDLGPAELRLFALALGAPSAVRDRVRGRRGGLPGDEAAAPRDLTPAPGRALDQQAFTVAPDGGTVVTSWRALGLPGRDPVRPGRDRRHWWRPAHAAVRPGLRLREPRGRAGRHPARLYPDRPSHPRSPGRRHHRPHRPGPDDHSRRLHPRHRAQPHGLLRHLHPGHRAQSRGLRRFLRPGHCTESRAARPALPFRSPRLAPPPPPAPPAPTPPPAPPAPGVICWPGSTGGPPSWPGPPDSAAVYFTADDQGRRPVFRVDVATGEVTRITTDDGAYTDLSPSPDGRFLYALRSSVDEPPTPVRLEAAEGQKPARLAQPRRPADPARPPDRDRGGGRRRHPDPELAGAAPFGVRAQPGPAAAVGPRRPDVQLELLVVALEPVADGRARLRGAAARPGPVHRVRPGLHCPGLPPVGRPPVRRRHGGHRRGAGPPGHRRLPHGHDGRLLRRLHGELDRRAHRPVRRHRQPRRACG